MHLICTTVFHLVEAAAETVYSVVFAIITAIATTTAVLYSFAVMVPVFGPILAFSVRHPIFMFIFCPVTLFVGYVVVSDLKKQARDPAYAAQKAEELEKWSQERLARKAAKKARQRTTPHINIGRFMQC